MTHWNTKKIIKALRKLPGVKTIEAQECGGDVDTEGICIGVEGSGGEHLYLCGFVVEGNRPCGVGTDDMDVEMVELTDGQETNRACSSSNRNTIMLYAEILYYLRSQGFYVVPSMDSYF